jgi:hypothetical protein
MSVDVLIKSDIEWKRLMKDYPGWFQGSVNLCEIKELEDSPHVSMIYYVMSGGIHRMTIVVQGKNHLNRQYFKNFNDANNVLSKFTLGKHT